MHGACRVPRTATSSQSWMRLSARARCVRSTEWSSAPASTPLGRAASTRIRGGRAPMSPLWVSHAPHCGQSACGGVCAAAVEDPTVARKILECLKLLGSRAPARARGGWHPGPGAGGGRLALRSVTRPRRAVASRHPSPSRCRAPPTARCWTPPRSPRPPLAPPPLVAGPEPPGARRTGDQAAARRPADGCSLKSPRHGGVPVGIDITVRPAEGWRIQRELVPPGQESGAL